MRLFFTVLLCAGALCGSAAHNMWLLRATSNHLNITHTAGTEEYVLYTTGTDPFVSMSNLERPLASDETKLVFEYMASKPTGHVELFFHYPATAGVSRVYAGLIASGVWQTATLDIATACNDFLWGAVGDQLRIDFGNVAGNTIRVRNIRIVSASGDGYSPRTDPFGPDAVAALGMPVVEITTDGGVEPTCDYVSPPDGSIGAGITNATKVPGRVRVIAPDGSVTFDSGEYEKGSSGMTVKIRGNTSAYTPKKPYKIKLQKKGDMLGRGDKRFNDKNWVLIKDEEQLMRNGFKLGELTGQQWAPQGMYVNVVFNGRFRGFYLLAEAVERNTSCRLDVADNGFIAEMDAYWWNEDGAYFLSVNNPVHNYTLKYPDFEDLTSEQKTMIQYYLSQFENSIESGHYAQYIDVASFANWLVAHDILGTLDSAGANMLLTRYDLDASTPFRMGNLWDFDSTEKMSGEWSNVHTHNFTKYFNSPDKTFTREFVHAYYRHAPVVFSRMMDFISAFNASEMAVPFERSLNLDNEMWNCKWTSGAFSSRRSINWYASRWQWMESAVAQLAETSGIDDVDADDGGCIIVDGMNVRAEGPVSVYDITGRRVAYGLDTVELPSTGMFLIVTSAGSRKYMVR